jgi:GTP cyclohydrolase II
MNEYQYDISIKWHEPTFEKRKPIIHSYKNNIKNCIGGPFGPFVLNQALGLSTKRLQTGFPHSLPATSSIILPFSPHDKTPELVAMDPWGYITNNTISKWRNYGIQIYSSIAHCKAELNICEINEAIHKNILKNDGVILNNNRITVDKYSIAPVWHLPGIAKRLKISELNLRQSICNATGGGYSELLNDLNLEVFLPPTNETTVYCIGNFFEAKKRQSPIGVRIHDECNSSDVFGSTICTCRPYLIFSLIEMIKIAQNGGAGILIYSRQEGKGFGEVSKFQVYQTREMNPNGNNPGEYFNFTKNLLQADDLRFHELSVDPLLWLGVKHINYFYSMSPSKYNAILQAGIKVIERIPLDESFIEHDAFTEFNAKKTYGKYYQNQLPCFTTTNIL